MLQNEDIDAIRTKPIKAYVKNCNNYFYEYGALSGTLGTMEVFRHLEQKNRNMLRKHH
jgi:hypothetical protein